MLEQKIRSSKSIEKAINVLWELHDEAKNAGDTDAAHGYADRAFELLSNLPENLIFVQTHH